MGVRNDQKIRLRILLQSIVFGGLSLSVVSRYVSTNSRYPYVFITSGGMTANTTGSRFDTGTFNRLWEYKITVVFDYSNQNLSSETTAGIEQQIDDIEELILDKLQSEASIDRPEWLDMYITSISDTELNVDETGQLVDNHLLKTFTVVCREMYAE